MFRELAHLGISESVAFPFAPWPDSDDGGIAVDFRLVYDGKLPAASRTETRNREKDTIRRIFSKQLAELFNTHPGLRNWHNKDITVDSLHEESNPRVREFMRPGVAYSTIELMAHRWERCGTRYVPLVTEKYGIACSLDILFLRRDQPGNLIVSGGDLDNRLKVLFDALRLPQNCDEVLPPKGGNGDDPIYVLLQDDRLIVDVKVTSDRLLTPRADGEHINDVRLVIHVKTVIVDATQWGAILFG